METGTHQELVDNDQEYAGLICVYYTHHDDSLVPVVEEEDLDPGMHCIGVTSGAAGGP